MELRLHPWRIHTPRQPMDRPVEERKRNQNRVRCFHSHSHRSVYFPGFEKFASSFVAWGFVCEFESFRGGNNAVVFSFCIFHFFGLRGGLCFLWCEGAGAKASRSFFSVLKFFFSFFEYLLVRFIVRSLSTPKKK